MSNLEDKLELIKNIKKFAVKELGIVPNNSFKRIKEIDGLHVLYASRRDKVKSIINNRWKILQYVDEKECELAKRSLKSNGYDVLKMEFEAWGDKNCQITPSMIASSKTRVAYLVLHENFHIQCSEKNINISPSCEEALGDCFAHQGLLEYFASNPSMIGHIKKDFQEWQEFFDFINKYLKKLEEAYKKSETEGRKVLILAGRESKRFRNVIHPVNNAYFVRQQIYSSMARPIYEAFKDMNPREYISDKRKIYDTLRKIKYKKSG